MRPDTRVSISSPTAGASCGWRPRASPRKTPPAPAVRPPPPLPPASRRDWRPLKPSVKPRPMSRLRLRPRTDYPSAAAPARCTIFTNGGDASPTLIPEPHHFAALLAETLDPEADQVAGFEEFRRLLALSDAGRRAGGDHVAGLQHHELRHVGDDMPDVEDHGPGRAGLHAVAVHVEPHR